MNKKIFLHLMAIMMVAMLSVGFTSCGNDEDETKIDSPIVGTWKTGVSSAQATIVFNANGTVILTSVMSGKQKTSNGTFEVSDGTEGVVKIYWADSSTPEFLQFIIKGNKMTTTSSSGTLTWTKQ